MNANQPTLDWLENPEVFAVNRLAAHSDHPVYARTKNDLERKLDGTWKFSFAPNPSKRKADFYQPGYDVTGWDDIQVPGHIQFAGYLNHHYTNTIYPWDGRDFLRPPYVSKTENAVGSYVTEFLLSEKELEKDIILTFEGVECAFYVWVNGQFVGYSEDSFTPAHFDITPYVKENNTLAVEVYQRSSASWLEDQDFWRFFGIFRSVVLHFEDKMHIADVKISQDIDLENHNARLKVDLKNKLKEDGVLMAALYTADGEMTAYTAAKAEADNTLTFDVNPVHLWSAEDPYLYTLKLALKHEGQIVEQSEIQVGFRKFEMKDGIMQLNGKRILFRGVNRHEFNPYSGRVMSKEMMEEDAKFMKRHNINAVRTSHYPNSSYWYELADKYGFYLIDEANLESHGSWQKLGEVKPEWNVPGSLPEWKEAVVDRARSVYERDKNHPAILIWSCGNESYAGEDILAMASFYRDHDPERLVHYEGCVYTPDFDECTDMHSRMYAKPTDIEEYLKTNPAKPFINCEYMHAMGTSLGNMQEYLDLEKKYEKYQGGFIWDFCDQAIAVEKDGKTVFCYGGDFADYPTDYNFCGNGLVLADRSLTGKSEETKQLYAPLKIEVTENGMKMENEALFDTLSNLALDCITSVDGKVVKTSRLDLSMEPGTTQFIPFSWPEPDANGVWIYTVSAVLKHETLWAQAGYEISFGQRILKVSDFHSKTDQNENKPTLTLVEGDGNIGVKGDDFAAMFMVQKGLISLKKDGQELLKGTARPDFFRALTDNDMGAGYGSQMGIWMSAGAFTTVTDCKWKQLSEEAVKVSFTYAIPFVNEKCLLDYTVHADGSIDVHMEMKANPDQPMLPAFGLRLYVQPQFDQLTFLAQGPFDSYCDRNHQKIGLYSSTPADEYVNYLNPQECGNHMDTWMFALENQNHQGLAVKADKTPLQFSALEYTPEELQNADHKEKLPLCNDIVVRILSEQMGIGGDDSWGAPVHDQWLIDSSKDLCLDCTIQLI